LTKTNVSTAFSIRNAPCSFGSFIRNYSVKRRFYIRGKKGCKRRYQNVSVVSTAFSGNLRRLERTGLLKLMRG